MKRFAGVLLLLFLLGACVRPYPGNAPPLEGEAGTELPSGGAPFAGGGSPLQGSPSPAPTPGADSPSRDSRPTAPAPPAPYAVVLVSADSGLNLRSEPALDAPILALLPYDARDLRFTGGRVQNDGVAWMELETPWGTGWASAAYLSQQVAPDALCTDARGKALVDAFAQAVVERNGEALAELLSPLHGLTLQWTWWGPGVFFSPQEARTLFESATTYQWGRRAEDGLPVEGTFAEVVAPALQNVLGEDFQRRCNSLEEEPGVYAWPYSNLPYVLLSSGQNAWAVGVVWFEDSPYLSVLVQYRE